MKFLLGLTAILISSVSMSQSVQAHVSGQIFNPPSDSIYISQFLGNRFVDYGGQKLKKDGGFDLKANVPNPDYYVLRIGEKTLNLVVRDTSTIKVYGDGKRLDQFVNFVGSEESQGLNEYLRIVEEWNVKTAAATALIETNPSTRDSVNQAMGIEFNNFRSQQQNFVATHRNSAALYPVVTTIDPAKDFASYEMLVNELYMCFSASPSVKQLKENLERIKKERAAADVLAPGNPAPDFEEKKPDGTTMKLSDLKGQVVLLDFWASWCMPCRAENPNVVKMYEKYKEDGFTVMSVSLDNNKEKWLAAIAADKLTWPNHVSDLQQWSSKVGKIYGVRGIPFTVLIDQQGNIVKTKLRGPELEQELQRIFGH